jgi:isovaleryl-CoA dehydrogenase
MRATPDFDFQLGEAAEMIRDTTARFADEQIAPLADRTDREDRFPRELWEPMGALGLHGITVEDLEWMRLYSLPRDERLKLRMLNGGTRA